MNVINRLNDDYRKSIDRFLIPTIKLLCFLYSYNVA